MILHYGKKFPLTASTIHGSGEFSALGFTRTGPGDNNPVPVIAYYDNQTGTVRLAYPATFTGSSPNSYPNYQSTWVRKEILSGDLRLGSGRYISMAVGNDNTGNPAIVYADSNRIGNYDSIRMAYKSGGGGAAFTRGGGWEAVSLPSDYQVKAGRLNVEVWPPANRGPL